MSWRSTWYPWSWAAASPFFPGLPFEDVPLGDPEVCVPSARVTHLRMPVLRPDRNWSPNGDTRQGLAPTAPGARGLRLSPAPRRGEAPPGLGQQQPPARTMMIAPSASATSARRSWAPGRSGRHRPLEVTQSIAPPIEASVRAIVRAVPCRSPQRPPRPAPLGAPSGAASPDPMIGRLPRPNRRISPGTSCIRPRVGLVVAAERLLSRIKKGNQLARSSRCMSWLRACSVTLEQRPFPCRAVQLTLTRRRQRPRPRSR